MAITVTNLGASTPAGVVAPDTDNGADQTGYDTASWTPPSAANCIILAWVYNTKATTLGSAPTLVGNSLTWTQQASVGVDPGAQTHRLTCFAAISTGTATAGITTANFAGVTQTSCLMMFQQVEGVDLTGALAGAIIQEPTNSTSSANSLAVTLSAASNAANRFFAGIGHGQPEGVSFEAGWDELDDFGGTTPGHALAVGWDSDSVADVTPSASWTTAGAAVGVAIEVKAAPSGGSTYEAALTVAKVNAITDGGNLVMSMAATMAKVNAVTDANIMSMFPALTLAKVNSISSAAQADLAAVLSMVKTVGVSPASIATMGAALSLGRNEAIVLSGNFLVLVSKGYVTVIDFAASPVTTTSFASSSVDTEDF